MGKIHSKHAVMSLGVVAFIGSFFALNNYAHVLKTKAVGSNEQVTGYIQDCTSRHMERLNTCLKEATTRPGVRGCLEGYWKAVNICVTDRLRKNKTGSGWNIEERRLLEKKMMEQREGTENGDIKKERAPWEGTQKDGTNKESFHPDSAVRPSMKPSTTNVRPSFVPGTDGEKRTPPVTRPRTTQKPNVQRTHNRQDEI